jgi:hypothetical protein
MTGRRRGYGQRPWWVPVPGMNWRGREHWPPRAEANARCAMECAARLIRLQLDGDKPNTRAMKQVSADVRGLREWLDAAQTDEDAWLRRTALCLITGLAQHDTTVAYVLECARAMHHS